RIDRGVRGRIELAELAYSVEVLQREPQRVHHAVAAMASWVRAVEGYALTEGFWRLTVDVLRQCWDVRRRRGRRRAEYPFHDPGPTQYRGSPIGVRGEHQDRAFAQKTPALGIGQLDPAELPTLHVLHAIQRGE